MLINAQEIMLKHLLVYNRAVRAAGSPRAAGYLPQRGTPWPVLGFTHKKDSPRNQGIKQRSGKTSNIKNKFREGRTPGSFMQF